MTDSDPIKDIVYRSIERFTEEEIQMAFLHKKGPEIINSIVSECICAIQDLTGETDENVCVMATVLMHYLCTILLIPTQRKTTLDDVYLDIVVPDTKTLRTAWNSSLVICMLSSTEQEYIKGRIADVERIQPNRGNIWLVSPGHINVRYKTFVIRYGGSFSEIIDQINEFLKNNRSAKFRIFKAV